MAAVPSPRGLQAVPLADALFRFENGLRLAAGELADLPGGRGPDAWRACRDGLEESLRRAERLRLEAPVLDYESLVAALGELMDPLDAFADERPAAPS